MNWLSVPSLRSTSAVVLVVAALGAALLVYFQSFGSGLMDRATEWTAASAAYPLQLLGTDVDVRGTVVASDAFAYRIVAECTLLGPWCCTSRRCSPTRPVSHRRPPAWRLGCSPSAD